MSMGDILAAHKKNLFGVTFETTSVHIKTFFHNFIHWGYQRGDQCHNFLVQFQSYGNLSNLVTLYCTKIPSIIPTHKNEISLWMCVCWTVWPDGYITIQSLAIYNNDNLPIKIPRLVKKFAKYFQIHPKIAPKTFKNLPEWRNYAKYGHTDGWMTS